MNASKDHYPAFEQDLSNFYVISTDVEEKAVRQTFLVVFGGMDTCGQIFDDCLGFLVKE